MKGKKASHPMLITYNSPRENFANVRGEVSNMRAHPDLNLANMILSQVRSSIFYKIFVLSS